MSFSFSVALVLLISSPLLTSLHALDVSSACPDLLTSSSLKNYKRPSDDTLLVVVPWKVRFQQFVQFNPDTCFIDGFSIQVFLQALRHMQPQKQINYKFVLHGDGRETPKYDEMVDMVAQGVVDIVVADLTITRSRMNKVDFTMPYLATPLVMITTFSYGSAGTHWDFLSKPFLGGLWSVLGAAFVFTVGALFLLENDLFNAPKKLPAASPSLAAAASADASAFATPRVLSGRTDSLTSELELSTPASPRGSLSGRAVSLASAPAQGLIHRANLPSTELSSLRRPRAPTNDQASHTHRLWNAVWFTSLCVFRAQQESVRTPSGRIITVSWLFVMLIFNSSYTASLSSLFSAQKRYPTIENFSSLLKDRTISVGYLENSIVSDYVKNRFKNHRLVPISNETSYINALKEGNGMPSGVGAVLDELPFVQIILQSECFFVKDPADDNFPSWAGFAFAFSKTSDVLEEMSEAIVAMQEDGTLKRLQKGWGIGGAESDSCSSAKEPSYLRFRSFQGLFFVLCGVYVSCLACRFFCTLWGIYGERCMNVARAASNFCRGVLFGRHLSRVSDGRFEDEDLSLEHSQG